MACTDGYAVQPGVAGCSQSRLDTAGSQKDVLSVALRQVRPKAGEGATREEEMHSRQGRARGEGTKSGEGRETVEKPGKASRRSCRRKAHQGASPSSVPSSPVQSAQSSPVRPSATGSGAVDAVDAYSFVW